MIIWIIYQYYEYYVIINEVVIIIYVILSIILSIAGSFCVFNSTVLGITGALCPVIYLLYRIDLKLTKLLETKNNKSNL